MDKEYLIIYKRLNEFNYYFLETEKELTDTIDICIASNYKIMFAAKIAVTKEFIG
jgi:hypothetical protein